MFQYRSTFGVKSARYGMEMRYVAHIFIHLAPYTEHTDRCQLTDSNELCNVVHPNNLLLSLPIQKNNPSAHFQLQLCHSNNSAMMSSYNQRCRHVTPLPLTHSHQLALGLHMGTSLHVVLIDGPYFFSFYVPRCCRRCFHSIFDFTHHALIAFVSLLCSVF